MHYWFFHLEITVIKKMNNLNVFPAHSYLYPRSWFNPILEGIQVTSELRPGCSKQRIKLSSIQWTTSVHYIYIVVSTGHVCFIMDKICPVLFGTDKDLSAIQFINMMANWNYIRFFLSSWSFPIFNFKITFPHFGNILHIRGTKINRHILNTVKSQAFGVNPWT